MPKSRRRAVLSAAVLCMALLAGVAAPTAAASAISPADRAAARHGLTSGVAASGPVSLGPGVAVAVNDRGEVAGTSDGLAVVWRAGRRTVIGEGRAIDINGLGHVLAEVDGVSVLWRDGRTTVLPFEAAALNDLGVVVGVDRSTEPAGMPVRWARGVVTPLATPPVETNGAGGRAEDVNLRGDVVGSLPGYLGRAFDAVRWRDGEAETVRVGTDIATGTAVSASGAVVGTSMQFLPFGTAVEGFLWVDGELIDLGGLGYQAAPPIPRPTPVTTPYAVRDDLVVVGESWVESGAPHAFVWEDGAMTDLGPGAALDVNRRGDVVGTDGTDAVVWQGARGTVRP